MPKIDFPVAISDGQEFTASTGVVYTYVGTPPNGYWSAEVNTGGGGGSQDLQSVTDEGNTTTNGAEFGGGNITLNADGSADFAGDVGIGTSSPSAKLQVNGTGDMVVSQSAIAQSANLFLGKGGPSKVFSVDESGNLKIGSNLDSASTTSITLATNGSASFASDVKIGGTLPSAPNITLNANGSIVTKADATINSVTVGRGGGSVSSNTAVGNGALNDNTTGSLNTALGWQALYANTEGIRNTAVGRSALQANTIGKENTAVGINALYQNTTGTQNTAVGDDALNNNTEGNQNTAVGQAALTGNTTGNQNTAVGRRALFTNTTGAYNTAVGQEALLSNTEGARNTAFGLQALYSNTTGANNVAVGESALANNTEGAENIALGRRALFTNTTGTQNTALGRDALNLNTTGQQNTAVGSYALVDNTEGTNNTAVGLIALGDNITGSYNTACGAGAGRFIEGDNNTILGAYTGTAADASLSDTVIISAGATERMRITSDPYVRLASGSGGIQFNGDTAAANALNDYEEGTWTPTMDFATGYGTQSGKYVKVGKTVHVWFEIQVTGWSTSTAGTAIVGVPFDIDKITGCWAAVINGVSTTVDWRIGPTMAGGFSNKGLGVWMSNGEGSVSSTGITMTASGFGFYSSLTGSLGTNFTMRGGWTYISTT